jgi:ribonuclease HI
MALSNDFQNATIAALRALRTNTFNSKLVAECQDALKRLTIKSKLTLICIPGHTGIAGNEIANKLANKGLEA